MRHKVTAYGSTNRHGVTTQKVHNAFTIMITRLVTPEDKGIKILQNVSIYQLTRRNIPNDMKLQRSTAETSNPTMIYVTCSYALNLLKQPYSLLPSLSLQRHC